MMNKGKSKAELKNEFNNLPKDWYSIYNWKAIGSKTYVDDISSIIFEAFNSIKLETKMLRQSQPFKVDDHIGTCEMKETDNPLLEKRFCRALFNSKSTYIFGSVEDYEVPLKESRNANFGDIDLLSYEEKKNVFIIEAKTKDAKTPILKAVLQCYTYSLLVNHVRSKFYNEYGFDITAQLTPAVLIFAGSECEKELREIHNHGDLGKLISTLNESCKNKGIEAIRFFMVNEAPELVDCIITKPSSSPDKPYLFFKAGFIPIIREFRV